MSDLRELYQDVILDHNRKPRNHHKVADANRLADGFNPLCGDKIRVTIKLDGDRVVDVGFEGGGCAISTASASLMTEAVKGKTLEEVQRLFEGFHGLVTSPTDVAPDTRPLGKLAAFAGVREFPVRVKCATLAWHTLKAALENEAEPVSTE